METYHSLVFFLSNQLRLDTPDIMRARILCSEIQQQVERNKLVTLKEIKETHGYKTTLYDLRLSNVTLQELINLAAKLIYNEGETEIK